MGNAPPGPSTEHAARRVAGFAGEDLAVAASPISFASPNDPPFLIMHSEGDPIVPFEQSKELYDALKKVKAEVQLIKIPGQEHVFMDETNFGKAIDFFQTKA